jgi:hypothetical protein
MAWLGEELPEDQQDAATPFAPRCVKDVLEEELFAYRRDLLTTLDIVFMETASLYFEGAGGQTLGRRGFSKDHRPDLNQMILAVLLDGDGRPVCTEMWPGNTADVGSLIPAIDGLQRRFRINRVCVVADRGMISAETIAELEARGLIYVLGAREQSDKLVSTALKPGANIVSDGLACFAAVTQAGCLHSSIKTGSGKQAARTPAFKWINTALGNIKAALVGTYQAVREKHVPRYLAEFEDRFNRRYNLETMIPRLAFVALRTAPMPYRLLKLAHVAA